MELDKQYTIQFSGLKVGKHVFKYNLKESFFDPFLLEEEEPFQVDVQVDLELEKLSTMLILNFHLYGKWFTICDRCGDDLTVDIEGDNKLFVKFDEVDSDKEDVVTLGNNEFEINISPFIYEYFLISLPSRKVHDIKDCNQEALKRLEDLTPKEQSNPIWDKLKDLN